MHLPQVLPLRMCRFKSLMRLPQVRPLRMCSFKSLMPLMHLPQVLPLRMCSLKSFMRSSLRMCASKLFRAMVAVISGRLCHSRCSQSDKSLTL